MTEVNLTAEDVEFLKYVFEKAPLVEAQCVKFLRINDPILRMALASSELQRMPRAGYALRLSHIPGIHIETVAEHKEMIHQMHMHFGRGVLSGDAAEYEAQVMIDIHDYPEGVVTDLTPGDLEKYGMTKAEKLKLEYIGMKILYRGAHDAEEKLDLFQKFNDRVGEAANWVADLDMLSIPYRCVGYEQEHGRVASEILQVFWKWAEGRAETPKGKEIFNSLKEKRAEIASEFPNNANFILAEILRQSSKEIGVRRQ